MQQGFGLHLGNPSIKKSFILDWFIALSSNEQVIATGTMVPFVMWFSIKSPNSDPGLLRSSRSKSPAINPTHQFSISFIQKTHIPAERCTNPNFSTIFEHWVPFPDPGAPKTNTTLGLAILILVLLCKLKWHVPNSDPLLNKVHVWLKSFIYSLFTSVAYLFTCLRLLSYKALVQKPYEITTNLHSFWEIHPSKISALQIMPNGKIISRVFSKRQNKKKVKIFHFKFINLLLHLNKTVFFHVASINELNS